jgi:membrane peptidoglycan carboxypeptidase
MAQVAAAFANHGEIPALHLTQAVRAPDGEWELPPPEGSPRGTISRASAGTIARWMAQAVETGAARAARLPGRQVYGHTGLALAGPEGTLNAWFIGFVTHENGQVLAIAVLLEGENDASVAARIGGEALQIALDRLP